MTEFTFGLLVIGTPGAVCYFLCQKLIGKPKRTTLEVILLIFLFAVLGYALASFTMAAASMLLGNGFRSELLESALHARLTPTLGQTVQVVAAGVVLAYLLSYLARFNVVNLIGQKIGATRRYGDEDVWHYFHNAPDDQKNGGWIMVRDLRAGLVYYGAISTWSDSGMERELVLYDVSVYTNDGAEHLYDVAHLYVSRDRHDLTIEVPPDDAEQLDAYQIDGTEDGADE